MYWRINARVALGNNKGRCRQGAGGVLGLFLEKGDFARGINGDGIVFGDFLQIATS